jgi:hypothetical protein
MIDDTQFDALLDAGAAFLGIPIEPDWRPAIRMHMAISFSHAAFVLAFPLPDDADPAPVFRA